MIKNKVYFQLRDTRIADATCLIRGSLENTIEKTRAVPRNPLFARYTSDRQRVILAGSQQIVHFLAIITGHTDAARLAAR